MTDGNDSNAPSVIENVSSIAKATNKLDKADLSSRLFGETFDFLGGELAKWAKKKFTPQEERNLSYILNSFENNPLENSKKFRASQAFEILEWIDGAKDIDNEKFPKSTDAWMKALEDIASDSYELLRFLERIDPNLIENFERDKYLSFADAINLQEQKFGRISMPTRLPAGYWEKSRNRKFPNNFQFRLILMSAILSLPITLVIYALGFGFTPMISLLISISICMIAFALYVQKIFEPNFMKKILPAEIKFRLTAKGLYILDRLGLEIPYIYLEIYPEEEDRVLTYFELMRESSENSQL